jgi:hypothetical protein
MKNLLINLAGGLAGAAVLTLLHETIRRLDADAPRVDLVGEEGVNKMLVNFNADPLKGDALYAATLSGDLLTNSLYYSSIGQAKDDRLLLRGVMTGLTAGWAALSLTRKLDLDDAPVTRTKKTKALTVAYYLLGGLTTAATIKLLRSKKRPE